MADVLAINLADRVFVSDGGRLAPTAPARCSILSLAPGASQTYDPAITCAADRSGLVDKAIRFQIQFCTSNHNRGPFS